MSNKKDLIKLDRMCTELEDAANMGIDEWVLKNIDRPLSNLLISNLKDLRQTIASTIVEMQDKCENQLLSHSPMEDDRRDD